MTGRTGGGIDLEKEREMNPKGVFALSLLSALTLCAAVVGVAQAAYSWAPGTTDIIIERHPNAAGSQVISTTAGNVECDTINAESTEFSSEAITESKLTLSDSSKEADHCKGPFGTSPSIAINGCDISSHTGTTLGEMSKGESEGTIDINCPSEKTIVASAPGCTIKVGSQKGLGPVVYKTTNIAGPIEVVTRETLINNLHYSHSGALCGNGEGANGGLVGKDTITGFDANGNRTNVTVT